MLFSSILFLFYFLPAALLAYFLSPRSWRLGVLTLCSYLFYAWSDPRCLILLAWVTVADYTLGNLLAHLRRPQLRRLLVVASLTNSLGLLFWFKYSGFAQEVANGTLAMFGVRGWSIVRVVLPLGISFYTFESISYVVDI